MVDILILFQDDAEELATRIAWAAAERGYSVWGDPNHFAATRDDEIEAAASGASAVAVLWSPALIREAQRRAAAFEAIDPRKTAAAVAKLGIEPPGAWRDRQNFDLSRGDAAAIDGFIEHLARTAGAPTGGRNDAPVDRLRAAEEEAASWRAIRDLDSPEVFEAYIDRFGKKGLFSNLARKRRAAARAARLAAGDDTPAGAFAGDRRGALALAGAGALAASVVFGLLTLATGGDLRVLSGAPTEDALALQSAAEYGADLDTELTETREALNAAQSALEARNAAVAELEIALAAARSGTDGPEGGAQPIAAGADAAGGASEQDRRMAELIRRQDELEKELGRREADLAGANAQLRQAETALAQSQAALKAAQERAATAIAAASAGSENQDAAAQAERRALEQDLAQSREDRRRVTGLLDSARLRIQALETERSALMQVARKAAEERQARELAAQQQEAEQEPEQAQQPERAIAAVSQPVTVLEQADGADAEAGASAETGAGTVISSSFTAAPNAAPIPRPRPGR